MNLPQPKHLQMSTPIWYTLDLKNNPANYTVIKLANSLHLKLGHAYFVVFYMYDEKAIFAGAIESHSHSEITQPTPNGVNSSPSKVSTHN